MVITHGVMADSGCDEVARDQFCSLMNQLVKGMLPVRPGFPPDDRTCLIAHFSPAPVDRLPVALHIPLLKVGREPVHVLIIRQNGLCLGTEEVVVPHPDQGKQDGDVLFKGGLPEMDVHGMGTLEELNKMLKSYRAGDGKPYRRPEGISSAHPIPEPEHVLRIDAELS